MTRFRAAMLLFCLLVVCPSMRAQTLPLLTDTSARWLLDAELDGNGMLGYIFPDLTFGTAVEKPITTHFEVQGSIGYSTSRKAITKNGNSLLARETVIGWVKPRVGVMGAYERSWLWTSQFDKAPWYPMAGIVIRGYNSTFGPGRLYVSYVFATGCVWATPSNPCTIQSNRTQGIQETQEVRFARHVRAQSSLAVLHFCDQSNQNDPSVPRTCHWALTSALMFRFEIHGISKKLSY
jgi:hypothetical protein